MLAAKSQRPSDAAQLVVTGVRVGAHEGFDRVVVDLEGEGDPGWFVDYTATPIQETAGLPLKVAGNAFLNINIDGTVGWNIKDCLIADATLTLVNEAGTVSDTGLCYIFECFLPTERLIEGELIIKSRLITNGYKSFNNSNFSIEEDGMIVFRTGDIYGYVGDKRIIWRGRKEDYIQVSYTSFTLDSQA